MQKISKDSVFLMAGLAAILAGIFLVSNSGIFAQITGAIVSNATNVTQNVSAALG